MSILILVTQYAGVLYSICPVQVINCMRVPYLIPTQAWYSFYRIRRDERLSDLNPVRSRTLNCSMEAQVKGKIPFEAMFQLKLQILQRDLTLLWLQQLRHQNFVHPYQSPACSSSDVATFFKFKYIKIYVNIRCVTL